MIKLSADARRNLRRAITDHEGWNAGYRAKTGFSLATMSGADLISAASDLGIDVEAIAAASRNARPGAENAFPDDVPAMTTRAPRNDDPRALDDVRRALQEDQDMKDRARAEREKARWPNRTNDHNEGEPAPAADGTDKFSRLARMLADLTTTTVDEETVRAIVQIEIEKAMIDAVPTVRIELMASGAKIGEVDGHKHPEFSKLLRTASARDVSGYAPNVWIAGPAGSGKTFAVGQVARALDVPFHFNGAIGMAHELLGFIDGRGNYHRTAFREAYEHGGCYLFDEVDGSDNAALLALNAALANGTATFPDGVIKRHVDCRIFAAANTWGFGGTSDYVGRTKLDAAFLSRFPVRLDWGYDTDLEKAICGNPAFAERVQSARAKARVAGLKILITPRDSIAGAALIAAGFTPNEAATMTYCASISPDQRRMIGE